MQLVVSSTAEEISSLADECPGLGFILYYGSALVFKGQSSVENLIKIADMTDSGNFSDDSSNGFYFLSAFKLAELYQPKKNDLH